MCTYTFGGDSSLFLPPVNNAPNNTPNIQHRASPTELALDRLKERALLAKAVCPLPSPNPPANGSEYDPILGPLIHALLQGAEMACGLALLEPVGPGGIERVYQAVARAVGAAGRPRTLTALGKQRGICVFVYVCVGQSRVVLDVTWHGRITPPLTHDTQRQNAGATRSRAEAPPA